MKFRVSYVGVEPARNIRGDTGPSQKPMDLFAEGKIDAFLGKPPEPQELRARNIGHVILNSAIDRPWSQYFCCMVAGHRDYVRKYPGATKRVLRAIIKAANLCATRPEWAARKIVDPAMAPPSHSALPPPNETPYPQPPTP